jgi:mycofactocin precursor
VPSRAIASVSALAHAQPDRNQLAVHQSAGGDPMAQIDNAQAGDETPEDELVETLVEEVSIDGMCGVY